MLTAGRFAGKTAFITGAGSGIGAATARALVAEGARALLADVDGAAAESLALELGAGTAAVSLDVRDENAVAAALAAVGPLDVLVNVAGVGSTTTAPDTSLDTWEHVFAVNVTGTFLCCKHAIPAMASAGGGAIVNVASVAGLVGLRDRAAYCASKGAVIAFTRALALDHAADGIRVNAVAPGTIDTPWVRRLVDEAGESLDALRGRQLLGRLGTADEIAETILYLASDDARLVTGAVLVIDGGLTAA